MSDYPEYKDCADCKRPMRSGKWKAAAHPGTVVYGCGGRCQTCYCRVKRATSHPPKKPRPDVDVTATIQSLTTYLDWRRPYRAKTESMIGDQK